MKFISVLPVVALPALSHSVVAVFFVEVSRPFADALQYRHDGKTFFRKSIFHARRYLVIGLSDNDIVRNKLFERRCENSVRYVAHFLAKLAVMIIYQRLRDFELLLNLIVAHKLNDILFCFRLCLIIKSSQIWR